MTRVSPPSSSAADPSCSPIEVVDRLRFPPVESLESTRELEALLQTAREQGYAAAVRKFKSADEARYVLDPSRLEILDLVALGPDKDVLEIGSSLGQMSVELARRSRRLAALECVPGQAYFTAERCRQEGVDNVDVTIGGDDCILPYPDGSFDAVIAILVLEWCASRLVDMPIEEAQRRFLAEIRRVLRPGGQLLINTKNRYALRLLLGGRDEHAFGMRLGHAWPRPLMNLLLRRSGKPTRTPGRLHSFGALNRMLRDGGFADLRSYWLAPAMRFPSRIVETSAAAVRQARREEGFPAGENRRTRLVMRRLPAGWVKHVTPGLCVVATKPDSGRE